MKRVSDRLAGLVAALLLQVAFIALFLQTPHPGIPSRTLERELTFILPRLVPVPRQMAAPRAAAPPRIQPQALSIEAPPPPVAVPPAGANVQGLGTALFGCAPEHLNMLTPQERARCGTGFTQPESVAGAEPRSEVKDPARRAAELAEKNIPMRVPCTYIVTKHIGFTGQTYTDAGIDPFCALKGLINGFHMTNLPP